MGKGTGEENQSPPKRLGRAEEGSVEREIKGIIASTIFVPELELRNSPWTLLGFVAVAAVQPLNKSVHALEQ
jgi:hypothetical protein